MNTPPGGTRTPGRRGLDRPSCRSRHFTPCRRRTVVCPPADRAPPNSGALSTRGEVGGSLPLGFSSTTQAADRSRGARVAVDIASGADRVRSAPSSSGNTAYPPVAFLLNNIYPPPPPRRMVPRPAQASPSRGHDHPKIAIAVAAADLGFATPRRRLQSWGGFIATVRRVPS
jgi:hypothetical protein